MANLGTTLRQQVEDGQEESLIENEQLQVVWWYNVDNDDIYIMMQCLSVCNEKSRNGDTLGPVELIVWPEQGNQGDWLEHDDHGEVSIIIFGMSESSGFQKYSICWFFKQFCLCRCLFHCLCLCVPLWFLNIFHNNLLEYVCCLGSMKPTSRDIDNPRSYDGQTYVDR